MTAGKERMLQLIHVVDVSRLSVLSTELVASMESDSL